MILIIFNYLLINDKKKFIIFTSFISLFFVLILTIFYTYVSLKVYFVNPDLMFTKWMYAVHPISNEVLSSPYPRITGMSRIIAILSIVFFIFFLISKNFNARLILFITFNFFL